jgi:hypothetical protein
MVKKNRKVWREMGLFGPDSDPANQLLFINIKKGVFVVSFYPFEGAQSGLHTFKKMKNKPFLIRRENPKHRLKVKKTCASSSSETESPAPPQRAISDCEAITA